MNRLLSHALGCRMMLLLLVMALPGTGLAARGNIRDRLLSIEELLTRTEYERAFNEVQEARREPHGTNEDVTLSLYEGVLLYELRRKEEAQETFCGAFLSRPDAQLPVPVSPKIQEVIDTCRQQAKAAPQQRPTPSTRPENVKSSSDARLVDIATPPSSRLRQRALLPALAGGALIVAGGIAVGVTQVRINQFNAYDPNIDTLEEAEAHLRRLPNGIWHPIGLSMMAVGTAGLVTAAGMYLFGAPREDGPTLGLSTDGTSAILYGRWP